MRWAGYSRSMDPLCSDNDPRKRAHPVNGLDTSMEPVSVNYPSAELLNVLKVTWSV